MKFLFLLLLWCLNLPHFTSAATYYQLQGAFRSYPQSASGEAHFYYNEKLWSQSTQESSLDPTVAKPWKYGFWRAGAFVALHGQAGVKVEVFPIAIWQILLQRSVTSRFYDTQTLKCDVIECRGLLTRGLFKTSLALGYGDFFLVPSYSITDLTLDSSSKNFGSEEDNLVADRGGDQVTVFQWALGFKQGDHRWLIVSKESRMKLTKDHNASQYVVWSRSLDSQLSYFVGAGAYRSNHVDSQFSTILGLNWSVGENLSLFQLLF